MGWLTPRGYLLSLVGPARPGYQLRQTRIGGHRPCRRTARHDGSRPPIMRGDADAGDSLFDPRQRLALGVSAMLPSRRALVAMIQMIEVTTVEGLEVLSAVRTRIGVQLVSRARGLPCVRLAGRDPFTVLNSPDEGIAVPVALASVIPSRPVVVGGSLVRGLVVPAGASRADPADAFGNGYAAGCAQDGNRRTPQDKTYCAARNDGPNSDGVRDGACVLAGCGLVAHCRPRSGC